MNRELRTLSAFEHFLESIPLDRYREELMPVKTVEQDLPPDLNPLPAMYRAFWVEEPIRFPAYEEFFDGWWKEHLEPLDTFIRKYFWGCSHEFIFQGFKARLYRTLISVLTQFHFAYSWRAYCTLPLEASAELDMRGIDGLIRYSDMAIALQVKKETYRPEARGPGRFVRRRVSVDGTVEVPYTIVPVGEWRTKVQKARRPETRESYRLLMFLAERMQRWLPNGFVVFQPEYPILVERLIHERVDAGMRGDLAWDETLKILYQMSESL
ncbi:MAG: TaqI family restriction endonuclease [Thermoflexales bacterium]|nr:TaqI family restriction endonuclease [Thermoflexales bacterium]